MATQSDWKTALVTSYEQLNDYLVLHVPQFVGAIFLLLLGWLVAWLCSKLTLTIVNVVSRVWQKAAKEVVATQVAEIKTSHAKVVSRTVFWVVMLFFITAATSSLGLDFFSTWLNSLLGYVPQILAALFILLIGFLLGNIVAVMVETGAKNASFSQPASIANLVKLSVFFISILIAVEQLGINIQFITTFIIVVFGVLLFGIALAFGYGSKNLIANIVAARQAKQHFRLNEKLRIGDVEGVLVAITPTMLVLEVENGRIILPANSCLQSANGTTIIVEQNTPAKQTEPTDNKKNGGV